MTEKDIISRWDKMSADHKSDVFKLLADAVSSSWDMGYQKGQMDTLNRLMDIRDDLPFKYADHWTSRDSEAITMLFSEYEQIKE